MMEKLFFLLALGVLMFSCKNQESSNKPQKTEAGKDGYILVKSLPQTYPKDVYVYENATFDDGKYKGKEFHISLMSDDSVEKIAETYRAKMKAFGWTESDKTIDTQLTMLVYIKPENRIMSVVVASKDNKRILVQTTATKSK